MCGFSFLSQREHSLHLSLKKLVTEPSSHSVAPAHWQEKKIISHLIKYLWVHLLFIYFDQCGPFSCRSRFVRRRSSNGISSRHYGPPVPADTQEITSVLSESRLQLQSGAKLYRIFSIECISPLSYPPRLEKLPSLWLNVMEMGNHWEAVVFSSSASTRGAKSQQKRESNYMYGGAGNGHAWCLTSFTDAAVLVCWLHF